ncbi:MAG: hypothetical protein M3Y71_16385 [Actinomycetota bacterium]|nr:hypothetical protein [Actinomycetota bacterium]
MTTGAHERATRRPRPEPAEPAATAAPGAPVLGGAGSLPRPVIEKLGRQVADLVGDLVADLERTVPSAVDAAYVVGSAAMRDHRRGLDDVDVVLVLAGHPDPLLRRLLDDVHGQVERAHPDLPPDLVYTTWRDLGRPPEASGLAAPGALGLTRRGGVTLTGPEYAPDAFTRHQLLDHGVAVIGPSVSAMQVAVTREALSAQCLRDIAQRWTPWWEHSALLLSAAGRASLSASVTDAVLQVARLHHILLTGEVLSLSAVGQWALTVCEPEWSRLVEESLLVRQDPSHRSLYRNPLARRRDVLAFTDLLMTVDEETFGATPEPPDSVDPVEPPASAPQVESRSRPGGRR